MKNLKGNLSRDIKNGTSLLEIVGENIEQHAVLFAEKLKIDKMIIKKEIINIVIKNLNEDYKRLCKTKN